jgi:hypothetical protein
MIGLRLRQRLPEPHHSGRVAIARAEMRGAMVARSSKMKVFRVPIGFHDAYVAAPSQKAAIEAWGSDRNVFARGEAEVVTDPALTAEPLARPGEVVKRLRGTAAEQLAALPPNKTAASRATEAGGADRRAPQQGGALGARRQAKPARKMPPRPSRAALDRAEAALAQAGDDKEAALKRLREQEAALAKERARLEKAHRAELEKLKTKRDKAAAAYAQAMERWRSS